jgi:hypothetical protein
VIYVLLGFALLSYIIWVYWHRFEIVNDGDLYLVRYKLLRTPWFRIFLHRIHRADQDRHLHNHPWPNAFSLILWGGYAERWQGEDSGGRRRRYFYGPGGSRWNRLTPETYHRIDAVLPHTWTLFFAGRRSRSWGFLTDRGHVDYRKYLGLPADHQLED